MSETQRSGAYSRAPNQILCFDYLHPLVQEKTLETIRQHLIAKGIGACVSESDAKRTREGNALSSWFLPRPGFDRGGRIPFLSLNSTLSCSGRECPGRTWQYQKLLPKLYQLELWNDLAVVVLETDYQGPATAYYLSKALYELDRLEDAKKFGDGALKYFQYDCYFCQSTNEKEQFLTQFGAIQAQLNSKLKKIASERDGVEFWRKALAAVQRAAPFDEVKQFDATTFEERFRSLTVKFRPDG